MSRYNRIYNPAFGSYTAGWTASNTKAALRRVTGFARPDGRTGCIADARVSGSSSARIKASSSFNWASVTTGNPYTASAYVYHGSNINRTIQVWFIQQVADGSSDLGWSNSVSVPPNTWVRIAATGYPQAGYPYGELRVVYPTMPDDTYIAMTCAMIEDGSSSPNYRDGDYSGWAWTGTAGYSRSQNLSPIVNAGVDQVVTAGDVVTCTATSVDPEGSGFDARVWGVFNAGGMSITNADLANRYTHSTTFTAPNPGTLARTMTLVHQAWDYPDGEMGEDFVNVTVHPANRAPTANAGSNQNVNAGVTVNLSGTGSSDPDTGDSLTYVWTVQNAGGTGITNANLTNRFTATPSFVAPNPSSGTSANITLRLTVTDSGGLTDTDDVVVTVQRNLPPTANAGPDQAVESGATVNLNGTGSSDPEGSLSYVWTVQNAGGTGLTNANITGRLTATPSFIAPENTNVGTPLNIVLRLTVTDNLGQTDTDDVTIAVSWAGEFKTGQGYAKIGLSAGASGIPTRTRMVDARIGLGTAGGGTKRAVSPAEARFSLTGRFGGPKIGIATGNPRAMIFDADSHGMKTGIATGNPPHIGLGLWGVVPPPVPIFAGRPLPEDPLPMVSARYLVQNILTGEWLHQDLPLTEDQVTLTLSGPCEITGKITPEMADMSTADGKPLLRSWGHVVYYEMDGEIRAAGLITEDSYDDQTQTIHCQGVSAYPKGIPYGGVYTKFDVDPLQIVSDMWQHVQSYSNGNLGVVVQRLGQPPVRLGISPKSPPPQPRGYLPDGSAPDPKKVRVLYGSVPQAVWDRLTALGYLGRANDNAEALYVDQEVLNKAHSDVANGVVHNPAKENEIEAFSVSWWDAKPCGDVIDDAIKACPADYVEQYAWNYPHTFVDQNVLVAYPRVGRRRDDLRFVSGENIVEQPELEFSDGFATAVVGIGAGEGSQSLRETAEVIIPGVLRKVYVYRNAQITDRRELARIVQQQLTLRSGFDGQEVARIVVSASHENARFGSYNVGDDIFVQVETPHWGWIKQWGRIVQVTLAREADLVQLELRRSDSFFYGREVES